MHLNNLAEVIDSDVIAQQEAGRRTMETLLNCYCREVAGPDGHLNVGPLFSQNDNPASVRLALQRSGGRILHIYLPFTGNRLLTVVSGASTTGNFRYQSPFYHKSFGKPWIVLDWQMLVGFLLNELSLKYSVPLNKELMQQIHDSVAVTAAILSTFNPRSFSQQSLLAFIESEQSLVYGHPFHPAPKSRQGVTDKDMRRYSPEMGASFPLHYFAVQREFIMQRSVIPETCDEIIAAQAPGSIIRNDEFALIPTHPWQARYLLTHPSVKTAIRDGYIRNMGQQGEHYYPTSSIRTLFNPENPYFYKCSLNIRITNCVRKNAVYELEGAVKITEIMRALMPGLRREFPNIQILEEPAFISIDLKSGDSQQDKEVTEGFGMILRQNFNKVALPGVTPLLAGALFGNHVYGEARLRELLTDMRQRNDMSFEAAAEQWFSCYVAEIMYPVLYCYFAHGIIFEPHLQNVLIGLIEGEPRQIFLRDFEGVKLVQERYDEKQLEAISSRAREALWYSGDQGWKRVCYCLFVNNLCEAINQLSTGKPAMQNRLWSVVRHHLYAYQRHYGDSASARRVNALMSGEPFPGKANLINRFFKRPDRAFDYLPVNNPLGSLMEGCV
ncbi:Siderophore synthetase component [Nitrosomonas aestuarii]|uniref:Siderophore synthetase component n=1 Tax=Nitrosomonas aestuarii TaxID=52441 RepID=A0A1I4DDG0_9PROT|nr:IucA/IucC family protein [Nitrosomonas aestuarii]SFK89961.1 Siderophore synthetase component [Nitrosomonas aestuarii]